MPPWVTTSSPLDSAATSADRAPHLKRALASLQAACEERPGLIVAWLNLASLARQLHASTLERSCLEHALEADSVDLGGYLYGSIHEPFFAAWRRALGERGPVWWSDGAPDFNRRMVKNTPYAGWYAELLP